MPLVKVDPETKIPISYVWAAPAVAKVQTKLGEWTVVIESEGSDMFMGDQPNWMLAWWAQHAVSKVIGHCAVFGGMLSNTSIPDQPNRPQFHARIIGHVYERNVVRIAVDRGNDCDTNYEAALEARKEVP